MKTTSLFLATVLLAVFMAPANEPAETKVPEAKAQATCPVMGGLVDKNIFVDVKGYRLYVCCNSCIAKVKADPDKYLAIIKANGETPAKAPASKDESKKEKEENKDAGK